MLERLRASARPRLLFVSHAFDGGVERHVRELGACVEEDAEVLWLRPCAQDFASLRGLGRNDAVRLHFHMDTEWEAMLAVLRAIGIDRVHYHHVHGFPPAVLDLPAALGCGHAVTLHDYYPICAEYHLTDGRGGFCGGEPGCQRCLEARPAPWPLSIDAWRARFAQFLGAADRVIVPSNDCAARIRAHLPAVTPTVWPHPRDARPLPAEPARVLVPGAISPAKGIDVLEACARDAAARGLPLHFRVLGFVARPLPLWPEAPLTISGEFPEGRLPELLAIERGDVVFFPAQCAETYSYTLTDALDTALPIVATDLGALPERLARRGNARIVRRNAAAAEINDALLAAAAPRPAAGRAAVDTTFADYRARYVEGLARGAPPTAAAPELKPSWQVEPQRADPPTTTIAWLYDDGVLCGKAGSLAKLRQRAADADARLAAGAPELEAARAAARAAEARVAELHGSTSWRLTAPLRRLVRWWRAR